MQNTKDSFYLALRGRLAGVNPTRQITIAGVTRPGILVEENEVPEEQPPDDVFVLRWKGTAVNDNLPAAMESLVCEIFYSTQGTQANQNQDRGRAMTEMDAELAAMLQPQQAPKQSVGTAATVPMATNIFWGDAVYGAVVRVGRRLERSVAVNVFALQEQLATGGLEL